MHFLGYVERNYSENIFIVHIPKDNSCDARSKQHLIIAQLQGHRKNNKITDFSARAC